MDGTRGKNSNLKKTSLFVLEGKTDYLLIGTFFLMVALFLLSMAMVD